jgi:hypothetical protein
VSRENAEAWLFEIVDGKRSHTACHARLFQEKVETPRDRREPQPSLVKATEMPQSCKAAPIAAMVLLLSGSSVPAQGAKELKTKSGTPIVVVNFSSPRPDCSANPGPIAVPVLREKPAHGIIQMQIVVTDIAASGNCPARKIPTTALVYTPNKDFMGTDTVQVEVETGNRTTTLSYRITVQAAAERL